MGSMWIGNSHYSYVFSFRGSLGAAYRPLNLVTTDSLAGKAGTAPIKTGGEMRKTHVNTGFHDHAESMGRLRRLRKSRYSLNNPETWARNPCFMSTPFKGLGEAPSNAPAHQVMLATRTLIRKARIAIAVMSWLSRKQSAWVLAGTCPVCELIGTLSSRHINLRVVHHSAFQMTRI